MRVPMRDRRANEHKLATVREEPRMKKLLLICMVAGAALLSPVLRADNYPNKPITLIAVFGPGSASDTICRVIAQPLGVALKETVVVENRPGANGALAALYVARSAADGYTLLMATNSPLSAVPFMMKKRDLRSGERLHGGDACGKLHADAGSKPELACQERHGADRICQGQSWQAVVRQRQHFRHRRRQTLAHWAEIDMLHVPYKSSPPAIQDVLAGRVSMMFTDLTTGMPHVRSGALRALAVTRLQRSSLFQELPTLDEAGVTGFDMDSWAGIVAPAHTPPAIVTQLNRELRKIIDDPAIKSTLGNVGFEAFSSSPNEFADFVKVQLGKWGKMVKDAGIQPE